MGIKGIICAESDLIITLHLTAAKHNKYYEKNVKLVMKHAGYSYEEACKAMSENDNDLINAIISFESKKEDCKYEKKDIELVMQQAGCTYKNACKAMDKGGGDIVNAIMSLSN